MSSNELLELVRNSRNMRETGIALVLSSLMLALFLLFPLMQKPPEPVATIEAPATTTAAAFANATLVQAKAVIVYDLATGKILYEKNADTQLPLASLTKLLTVYAALAEMSPSTPVTVPASALTADYPRALNEGQTFTLGDIAKLTLTASLNDGAIAIAEATASREQKPAPEALASAAAALGLSQTYALNGSGLDVNSAVSGGYGSARDLAKLAGALVEKAPDIAYATTQAFTKAVSFGGTVLNVKNTDPMAITIPHLLLSKTGFTDLAGGNLVLVFDSAIRHAVAVVVLGSTKDQRFTDAARLVADTYAYFAGVQPKTI
ncbi:MAG TPA: serine hydrolase [Candidatus Paceibacterota bacterium]|nr:serine hydrolase [Candidatus Paceibacterota bacterium]